MLNDNCLLMSRSRGEFQREREGWGEERGWERERGRNGRREKGREKGREGKRGRKGGRERERERKKGVFVRLRGHILNRSNDCAHKFQRPFIVVESPTSSDTNSPHLSLPPPQLTEVVDSVQEELKAMDSYSSDVVCVNELWQRYTHKLELA